MRMSRSVETAAESSFRMAVILVRDVPARAHLRMGRFFALNDFFEGILAARAEPAIPWSAAGSPMTLARSSGVLVIRV